jgi:hypothetical protein
VLVIRLEFSDRSRILRAVRRSAGSRGANQGSRVAKQVRGAISCTIVESFFLESLSAPGFSEDPLVANVQSGHKHSEACFRSCRVVVSSEEAKGHEKRLNLEISAFSGRTESLLYEKWESTSHDHKSARMAIFSQILPVSFLSELVNCNGMGVSPFSDSQFPCDSAPGLLSLRCEEAGSSAF